MTRLGHDLPEYRVGGNRLNARQHNNMVNVVGGMQRLQVGPGLIRSVTQAGIRLDLAPQKRAAVGSSGGATIARFEITEVTYEYLVAKRIGEGGELATDEVRIARPRFLAAQLVPFTRDGITYFRYVQDPNQRQARENVGDPIERHVLVPKYLEGDELYALAADTGVETNDDEPITWVDLNVDGRMWAVTSA